MGTIGVLNCGQWGGLSTERMANTDFSALVKQNGNLNSRNDVKQNGSLNSKNDVVSSHSREDGGQLQEPP